MNERLIDRREGNDQGLRQNIDGAPMAAEGAARRFFEVVSECATDRYAGKLEEISPIFLSAHDHVSCQYSMSHLILTDTAGNTGCTYTVVVHRTTY
jgi:hypothetical protein